MSCVFISVTLSCFWGKGDGGDERVGEGTDENGNKGRRGKKEVLGTRSPPLGVCLVVSVPVTFMFGVEENAHAPGDGEVIPCNPHKGDKGLCCGIKHGNNSGPRYGIAEILSSGVIVLIPADHVPFCIDVDGDVADGSTPKGCGGATGEIDEVSHTGF